MALVLGMTVIGCKETGIEAVEKLFNGTWRAFSREAYKDEKLQVYDPLIESYDYKITFNEGTFEESIGDNFICMGSYAVNNRSLTVQVTHVYGNILGLEYDSRWYEIQELGIDMIEDKLNEETYHSLPLILFPRIYTYYVGASALHMTTFIETMSVTTKYRYISE
jgi:hypothetical protein